MTLFFGARWDAPQVDDATQVDTPVGMACLFCAEPIEAGDRGLYRSYVQSATEHGTAPAHMECDLRITLGNRDHLEGRCTCTGYVAPGASTKSFREEARETLAWFNEQRAAQGRVAM